MRAEELHQAHSHATYTRLEMMQGERVGVKIAQVNKLLSFCTFN